jgi:uncharacterized protein YjbJ (UPF0337 family)
LFALHPAASKGTAEPEAGGGRLLGVGRRKRREQKGEIAMNNDQIAGKWKQMKGEAKVMWGKLTDDELDIAEGHKDKLAGKIQERYGRTREEAEREVDDFFSRY